MKLITRSEFDALRLDDRNEYDTDKSGDSQIVRIYRDGNLIAKKKTQKKSIRYFGVAGYQQFLPATEAQTEQTSNEARTQPTSGRKRRKAGTV